MFDIIPSENGRRVEPKISDDLIKRIQAAEKAKTRKEIKKEYDPVSSIILKLLTYLFGFIIFMVLVWQASS